MLSVGMLTYSTKPRGSVVCAAALADALTQAGHDVTLYALDKDGEGFFRPLKAKFQPIPASAMDDSLDRVIAQRIAEFSTYLEPRGREHDLYHGQDCLVTNALFEVNARGFGAPVIRTLHHIENFQSDYLKECQRRSVVDAHTCISISKQTQAEALREFGVSSRLIENGVSFQNFSSDLGNAGLDVAKRFRLNGTGPVLLSVGGVEPRKNSVAALAAFRQVRQRYPRAIWVIAGGATTLDHRAYDDQFNRQLARMRPDEQTAVVRAHVVSDTELAALYKICDVFLHPSLKEGFGLSVLEAVIAGARVVVSQGQPFDDYLKPRDAVRVNPGSVSSIAQGVLSALGRSFRHAPDIAGLKARFNWQHSAERHAVVYQQTLERVNEGPDESNAPDQVAL